MTSRRFPIMGAPSLASVPWGLMAEHEARVRSNHEQSLARLAERGGLSPCEALSAVMELDLRGLLTQPHGRGRCGCVEELSTIACSWSVAEAARQMPRCARCHHRAHEHAICQARSGGTAYRCGCLG